MCDLTTIDYQKGDVVWVKLGSLWWPGLVHDYDSLPEDIKADTQAFKKQPIAYVKFFQEDNFEYVKDIHSIYQYNCLRKKEFIKKGLDMMRSTRVSTSNMQMFPCDVITAENLTHGDPKILERAEFTSVEEGGKNVYEDLFSSPAQRKLKKKKDGKDSSSPAIGFLKLDPRRKAAQSKAVPKPIGQHRLLNLSEDAAVKGYKSKELIQDLLSNGVHEKNFTCVECDYHCSRVNVMLLHYKGHSRHFDHKIKYPTGFKRKKKSNHNTGSGGVSKKMKLTNGDMNGGSKRVKSKAELIEQQKQEAEKLKQNFLMDWDEDENENAEEEEKEDSLDKTASKEEEKVSCFDFDEEEEESPSKTNLNSFTARKKNYSKSEESSTNTKQFSRSESTNGTKCYGKSDDKSKETKCNLADEVDALLKETTVPTLPDIPKSKGGDAITLPPPVEAESGFGTLTSDLNESLDFRNDIVSKVTSTPVTAGGRKPGKLSKQTLKTNYFKKVREEIAEVAKFEEEDQPKQDEEFEDEDMVCDDTESSAKPKEETLIEETDATRKTSTDTGNNLVETPVTEPQPELPVTSGTPDKTNVSGEHVQNTTVELKTSECHVVRKTPEKMMETSPSKIKTVEQVLEKTSPIMKTTEQVTDKSPVKSLDKPKDTSPNIVKIGNQTIHIPNRRNSKTSSDTGETNKTERVGKTEEDTLAEMMLVEEVDLGNSEPVYAKQAKPTSTVHIDMSPNKSKVIVDTLSKPSPQQRTTLKTMPTIIPIERSKYKPINIPSTTTKQPVTVTPTKPATEEKYFILPNNQRIKTPSPAKSSVKTPVKSPIVLSSPDGGKVISLPLPPSSTSAKQPQQSQLVYMSKPSTSNIPVITMKSTQKKSNLPIPALRKLDVPANRLGTKTKLAQSSLQSKIKTISNSNATTRTSSPSQARSTSQGHISSPSQVRSSSQGHIVVNQSTLPSILQQRRSVQPTRATPPTLVPTPKVIEEAELLSEISNIPGTDSSDAVVYLINNQQSQQILINSPQTTQQSEPVVEIEPGPSTSTGQTIYIDPNSTDLSNIYLTIDDDGNILNIVQKPAADPVVPCSDILAKALADTQVLQAECAVAGVSTDHALYNNTYETSLTLNQAPIMSTSEAPSQIQHNSYFTNTSVMPPLIEIKPNQENIQGMASPEIAYAPSDIQA